MYFYILVYTTLNLKVIKINNASGASKKVRDVSEGGSEGFLEKRAYDVSCVQIDM